MADDNNGKKKESNAFLICMLLGLVLWWGYKNVLPKIDTSWVIETAVTEVKSDAYKTYGEIVVANGRILYNKDQQYIVIVKYEVPEWGVEASCACYVYGYREGNSFVHGMTREMAYDYNYSVEELKALWGIA